MEKKKRSVPLWLWYVLAALLILADQEVKLWVRTHMTLGGPALPFLPFVELLYVENTGAAFSLFHGYTWVLTALSAVMTLVLAVCLWKDWFTTNAFSRLCVTLVLAGAAGNLIDRAMFGSVTDMFNFTFMTFGVFNVADICVVGGVIGYAGYVIFAQRKDAREKEDGHEAETESP